MGLRLVLLLSLVCSLAAAFQLFPRVLLPSKWAQSVTGCRLARTSGLLLASCKVSESSQGVRGKRRDQRKTKSSKNPGQQSGTPAVSGSESSAPSFPLGLSPEQEQQIFATFADDIALSLEEIVECAESGAAAKQPARKDEPQKPREQTRGEATAKGRTRSKGATKRVPGESGGLDAATLLEFERNGHVQLCNVLAGSGVDAGEVLSAFDSVFAARAREAYAQKLRVFGVDEAQVRRARTAEAAAALLGSVSEAEGREVPFLQLFHLHRGPGPAPAALRRLAMSPALGRVAAELLGAQRVRLYQTAGFVKEPGHGETAWHSDLNTAPLDTNAMLTLWLPLTPVPDLDHAPLEFASGSHRDFSLAYWYSVEAMADLGSRDYPVRTHLPLRPGDCTAHHGWLLHASPPNLSAEPRKALAISYVADGARRLRGEGRRREPDDEDLESYAEWLKEVPPGATADALPLIDTE